MSQETQQGRIGTLVHFICEQHGLDENYVRAQLVVNFPELKDKKHCPNCGAGMVIQKYTANLTNAILLLKCAEVVRDELRKGIKNFTESNLVHVPSLVHTKGATEAVTKSATQCSYLNFIKQPKDKKGSGFYVVTNWGWKILRGEEVPDWVKVFRGEIIERSEQTTTLAKMFRTHVDKVNKQIELRKKIQADYRTDVRNYDPIEWADFGGIGEGKLF